MWTCFLRALQLTLFVKNVPMRSGFQICENLFWITTIMLILPGMFITPPLPPPSAPLLQLRRCWHFSPLDCGRSFNISPEITVNCIELICVKFQVGYLNEIILWRYLNASLLIFLNGSRIFLVDKINKLFFQN